MAASAKHEAMDAETVAELLGVSRRQLTNYLNHNGLPSQGEGRNRTFVWRDVLEWYIGYRWDLEAGAGNGGSDDDEFGESTSDSGRGGKEDIRQATLRKTRAEANLKELQLSRLRGQVIVIADAKSRLDRMMGNLRAKLLSMAPKLASRLEAEKERTGREAALKDELETLCREISTGAVVDLPADPDAAAGDPDVDHELDINASVDRPDEFTDEEYFQHLDDMRALYETAEAVIAELGPELYRDNPANPDLLEEADAALQR